MWFQFKETKRSRYLEAAGAVIAVICGCIMLDVPLMWSILTVGVMTILSACALVFGWK